MTRGDYLLLAALCAVAGGLAAGLIGWWIADATYPGPLPHSIGGMP